MLPSKLLAIFHSSSLPKKKKNSYQNAVGYVVIVLIVNSEIDIYFKMHRCSVRKYCFDLAYWYFAIVGRGAKSPRLPAPTIFDEPPTERQNNDVPRLSSPRACRSFQQSTQFLYSGITGGRPAIKREPVTAMHEETTWNGYKMLENANCTKPALYCLPILSLITYLFSTNTVVLVSTKQTTSQSSLGTKPEKNPRTPSVL
uniref:Uncharacterized protein n=1 Tax=Bactrocera dorsalis TaxID=27457 RepID=A0A034W813_BACDO